MGLRNTDRPAVGQPGGANGFTSRPRGFSVRRYCAKNTRNSFAKIDCNCSLFFFFFFTTTVYVACGETIGKGSSHSPFSMQVGTQSRTVDPSLTYFWNKREREKTRLDRRETDEISSSSAGNRRWIMINVVMQFAVFFSSWIAPSERGEYFIRGEMIRPRVAHGQ